MIIQEIKMKNFGKFTYKEIEFRKGINIVYGSNESGKSTVHSFIRGMLFGLEKKRGRASKDNLYEKYKPWEGSTLFSGSMRIEDDGEIYDVSRVFNADNKQLQCVNANNGQDCVEDDKIMLLDDMTENKYRNTISNEQAKVRVDKDLADEIKNYLANISTSKDREVNVTNAINDLNKKKRETLKKTTDEEIEELTKQVNRDEEIEVKLEMLNKKLENVNLQLSNEAKLKEEDSIRIIREYVTEYEDIKEEYKLLKELKDEKRVLCDIEEKVEVGNKDVANKLFSYGVVGIVSIIILVIFIAFGINIGTILASIITLVAGLAITYFFNETVSALLVKKESIRNINAEKETRENIERINGIISEKQNKILDYARRVYPLNNIDDEEMLNLDKEVSVLKNQIEGHVLKKEKNEDVIKIEKEKINWQINLMESDRELREARKNSLSKLKQRFISEKKEVDAINIAIEAIDELAKSIHFSISADLNKLISKYCGLLTEEKYTKVRVGEGFDISVYGTDRYIDIDKLSVGTIEQIYLAIRLAVAELFWDDKELPILLDESFAFYDKDRLKATLIALSEMENRQVIIFTCNTREATILEDANIDYNYVEL